MENLIPHDYWHYCLLCETSVVTCPDCGNSSCNGSGCDKCKDTLWPAVDEAKKNGTARVFSKKEIKEQKRQTEKYVLELCKEDVSLRRVLCHLYGLR